MRQHAPTDVSVSKNYPEVIPNPRTAGATLPDTPPPRRTADIGTSYDPNAYTNVLSERWYANSIMECVSHTFLIPANKVT